MEKNAGAGTVQEKFPNELMVRQYLMSSFSAL